MTLSSTVLVAWVVLSVIIGLQYLVLPRIDPGPTPLTRERRFRFNVVMLTVWICGSVIVLFQLNRIEAYTLAAGAAVVAVAGLWLKRRHDSAL